MYIKQKKLMSKCRACGNENILDGMHRAGTQLMKQLPKEMSEIDNPKDGGKKDEDGKAEAGKGEESDGDGKKEKKEKKEKKDKKSKKKAEAEEEEEPLQEEGIKLDSEEIGKLLLSHKYCLMMNTLSLPLILI